MHRYSTDPHRRQKLTDLETKIRLQTMLASLRHGTLKARIDQRELNQQQLQEIAGALKASFQQLEAMNAAALVIQRVYRGHCSRRGLDPKYITKHKTALIGGLKEITKDCFHLNFQGGYLPAIAGLLITRNAKKWLFAQKIERIRVAYDYYCNEQLYKSFALIRRVVYRHLSLSAVRWKQFKIYRMKRMQELKLRLAVLQIKKHWQILGLSYKQMKKRIRRFKRKLKPDKEPEALLEALDANDEPDSEEEELKQLLEAQRQYKVRMGKISYNIAKESAFLPQLSGLTSPDLPEKLNKSPLPAQYAYLRKSLFNSDGKPRFLLQKTEKKPAVLWKESLKKKSKFEGGPSYMKATLCSQSGKPAKSQSVIPANKTQKIDKRPDSTLMLPTCAHKLKRGKRYEQSDSNRPWKFSSCSTARYTPGLENSSFTPQQFHPRPSQEFRSRKFAYSGLNASAQPTKGALPPEVPMTATSPCSLSFESCLPEHSLLLSKYSRQLSIHVKPRVERVRSRL